MMGKSSEEKLLSSTFNFTIVKSINIPAAYARSILLEMLHLNCL